MVVYLLLNILLVVCLQGIKKAIFNISKYNKEQDYCECSIRAQCRNDVYPKIEVLLIESNCINSFYKAIKNDKHKILDFANYIKKITCLERWNTSISLNNIEAGQAVEQVYSFKLKTNVPRERISKYCLFGIIETGDGSLYLGHPIELSTLRKYKIEEGIGLELDDNGDSDEQENYKEKSKIRNILSILAIVVVAFTVFIVLYIYLKSNRKLNVIKVQIGHRNN